jgi:hypothetical protein
MHLCGCCEVDCAGGYSAKNSAGWWVDFSGGFSYLDAEYQRAFCSQLHPLGIYGAFQNYGVDAQQFLPSLEPLRDSILVQGRGAPNWTTCTWNNIVGVVDRWQLFPGSAFWSELIGPTWNCLPETDHVSRTPFDFRQWRLQKDEYWKPINDYPGTLHPYGLGTWYGEDPPDPTTLENYCQDDHPEGVGENNVAWQFADRLLGFRVAVSHYGGTDENGDKKQRLEVQLTWIPYVLTSQYLFSTWPYTPDPPDWTNWVNAAVAPGMYPPWYDEESLWQEQETGDGTTVWVRMNYASRQALSNQPVGIAQRGGIISTPDVNIRGCQALKLTNGRAHWSDLGTSNTVDDHFRIWRSDWLDGDQIDGVTPHVLNFIEPGTPELNWWDWLGLVNLPETLTLTPIGVEDLIDITGEEPQEEPEE